MEGTLSVLQLLNNLKNITRTGPNLFAGIPSSSIESISDHSYKVTYFCLIFSKYFPNINIGNLLSNALVHDWGEAIIMDIPTSSPSLRSYFEEDIKEIFKKAENKALNTIFSDIEFERPELSSTEKVLLDFSDSLAILFEMIDYKQKGYNHEWLDRMFSVQCKKVEEIIENNMEEENKKLFIELITSIKYLFEQKYMVNKYLTKATR